MLAHDAVHAVALQRKIHELFAIESKEIRFRLFTCSYFIGLRRERRRRSFSIGKSLRHGSRDRGPRVGGSSWQNGGQGSPEDVPSLHIHWRLFPTSCRRSRPHMIGATSIPHGSSSAPSGCAPEPPLRIRNCFFLFSASTQTPC